MTLDGQVLAIAFVALSLKLVIWGAGQDVVERKSNYTRRTRSTLTSVGTNPEWISDSDV
jgi:hypothetical protein